MKLYLFGGAEVSQASVSDLKSKINQVIRDIHPTQILHVPFARTIVPDGEESLWGEGWVSRDLDLTGIKLLDARNPKDLTRAHNPTIFINGGKQRDELYESIISNPILYKLVMSADHLIGESAGSMVCAQHRRTFQQDTVVIAPGLGIIKDTVIEAHYTQRDRHQALRDELKLSGAKYGLGIDSNTGVIIDPKIFPKKYQAIGDGLIELVQA